MKERHFVLIFGPQYSVTENLVSDLKARGYKCIYATKSDEIEQVGNQYHKVAVLFFDHKFAVNFLKESDLGTYHKFRGVFFEKRPIMNPKIQWIFDEIFLKIYYPTIYDQFFKDLAEFFSSNDLDKTTEDIESIEFTLNSVQNPFLGKK